MGTEAKRTALVVSPFATTPRDAGHRRRAWQMTRLLADAGYRVTLLLAAFEDAWAWRHDEDALARMRDEWDEVSVVYCGDQVGRPPVDGAAHQLDEWWDQALEHALLNLHARRFFDVVVVHNVWLSKAFDFIHPASVKVLETHDLFWKRGDAFATIGLPPSFFLIDRTSELFGIARADIAVTIQDRDARELLALTPRRVVNVPYYDPTIEREPANTTLRDERFVSFGCLGSAHPFNTQGLDALLAALEQQVAESFAPVEVVVGGSVGAAARTTLPIKRLGRVESEAAFYESVDYAIAPVFAGTGFKVKTADALALGAPMLASAHAAEGVALDRDLVCATPREMAARMVEISLRRPNPRGAQSKVLRARDDLRARAAAGGRNLLRAIAIASDVVVVDLHDASLGRDALKLHSWLAVLRTVAGRARVLLLLPPDLRTLVGPVLPPSVEAMDFASFEIAEETWPGHRYVDATAIGARRACHCRDDRWDEETAEPVHFDVPAVHPDYTWEPAAERLRRAWSARSPAPESVTMTLLDGGLAPRHLGRSGIRVIDPADRPAVETMLMRLLCGGGAREILIGGAVGPRLRQIVSEVCAVVGVPVHGRIDDAALAPMRLPSALPSELRRRADDRLRALISREAAREAA